MNTLYKIKAAFAVVAIGFVPVLFGEWKEGDVLPELSGFGLQGDLPELEGKVTYVDFWASWCAPCKAAFPEIERLYQKHGEKGFQVVAVSVDSSEKMMRRFLDRVKPSFATVWDEEQQLVETAEVGVMPTSFLVDGEGKIRSVHEGWGGKETAVELEAEILELLKEAGR
ncbi:TlpA disulfide reductase family protein [Pelagicoccus mobilis]|uniref:TlpA family protein disulfide reductase n=1 Tax=Pelagicoccus mobilis TaxID=415221 RepID=A0A934S6E5_9BACT|nr:TlpA disulfide reductase family protein [Pelagicoccus mobilis]MBK1880587.1 TlpA family protein disulfide reductase [Pelagicoccus mobilis]